MFKKGAEKKINKRSLVGDAEKNFEMGGVLEIKGK
jgi:hypothetical protein